MLNISPGEIERISSSEEFVRVLRQVNESNPRFRSIPDEQKKLALILLMTGEAECIGGLERIYTKRPMPTIEQFLTPEYLGEAGTFFYQSDNLRRKELLEIFSTESIIRQFVLTGSIGGAKTSTAITAQLFNLFRINCLRRPQLSMGSGPSKPMNLLLFTVTRDKAKSLLYDQVKTLLSMCQYYQEVQEETDFLDFQNEKYEHLIPWTELSSEGTDYIVFPNHVRIMFGSQARHALGEDVFGGILDEMEFREGLAHGKMEQTFNLYYEILERIRSRFLGSRYTLMCLVSSIGTSKGVMATHIEESRNRPDTKISQHAIWEVRYPNALKEHGYFYVMRGTQRHPSRVMTDLEKKQIEKGQLEAPGACEFIKVPEVYRYDFERPGGVERSLMNLAGQASMGQEIPFDDLSDVEDKSLMPVIEISAPLQGTRPLREQLPKEYFIQTPEGWRIRRYPGAPRYLHCDLADSGIAGISIIHKELSITGKVMYVSDMILKITSPNRISLDSVREFVFDLRDYYGIMFAIVTADQYQSTQLLQKLEAVNFASVHSGRLSVDTNRIPYDTLSALVAESTLKTGMMGDLRRELESIYFDGRDQRSIKPYSIGRKDLADAVCGSVFDAVSYPADVPSNSYEGWGIMQERIHHMTEEYEELV